MSINARNKRARGVTHFGISFPSISEGNEYLHLRARQEAGEITDLECQPKFILQGDFIDNWGCKVQKISYTADFRYLEVATGVECVVEIKGYPSRDWPLREKMFRYRYRHIKFIVIDV